MLTTQNNWLYVSIVGLLGVISPLTQAQPPQRSQIDSQNLSATPLKNALAKADSLKLANHTTWRRLLHYPDNPYTFTHSSKAFLNLSNTPTNNQNHSQIKDNSFFVDKNGNTDPHAELVAMLTELFNENAQTTNSVQCRFPARTYWLKQMLAISDKDIPVVTCVDTKAWLDKVNPESVELIFAEEYLESPASAFGHSFLRLDNATTGQNYILNYEPKVIKGENFLKFSYKSTLAGNMGVFSVVPYEEKIKQYRDHDGRDIWRYQLNLSPEERQQLARQIWEIKDQHPTYYLASDNCASEILLLLNALRPDKNYLKDFNKLVAPADIVRALDKQGVLKTAVYEPSLKSQTQALHNAKSNAKNLGQNLPNLVVNPADNNPQTASPLSRASLSIGQENGNVFTQLGYRGVYHDELDKRSGYPAGYYLDALSAKVRLFDTTSGKKNQPQEQRIRLEEATLIKARSLNPVNTAESQKPWGGHSWGGQLGLAQVSDGFGVADNRHLVANLGAEYGWSTAYGSPNASQTDKNVATPQIPPNICYALGTTTAQVGKGLQKGYRVGLGATLGCIQQFNENLRGIISVDLPYWYQHNGGEHLADKPSHQHGYWQPQATLGMQYDINKQQAFRLSGSYLWQPNHLANDKAGQLAYLYYF